MQELRALVAGREVSVSLVDRRPLLPPSQGGRLGGVVDRKLNKGNYFILKRVDLDW